MQYTNQAQTSNSKLEIWYKIEKKEEEKTIKVCEKIVQQIRQSIWSMLDVPKPYFFQVKGIFDYTSGRHSYTKNVLFRWEVGWRRDSVYLLQVTVTCSPLYLTPNFNPTIFSKRKKSNSNPLYFI